MKTRATVRFSPFMIFVFAALLVGTGLIMFEAYRSERGLLLLGVPFVALVAMATLYKAHIAAVEAKRLRLELRKSLRLLENSPKLKSSTPQASNGKGPPKLAKSVERLENQQRLRNVGVFKPNKVDTRAKGRQAAAVNQDPKRSYRLYAATKGTLSSPDPAGSPYRKVALIGSLALRQLLEEDFYVVPLHPGLSEAQFEAESPTCLIIEEAALQHGPWGTALSATGTALLEEILTVRNKATSNALHVYVLPSNLIEVSTHLLRSRATVLVDHQYGQEFIDTQRNWFDDEEAISVVPRLVKYQRQNSGSTK